MEISYGTAYKKNIWTHVKVTLSVWMGKTYIHIREYGLDGDTHHWFPTPKGYALQAEGLDEVIILLQKASKDYTIQSNLISNQLEFKFDNEDNK